MKTIAPAASRAASALTKPDGRLARAVRWFEATSRPKWALAVIVLALYAPSLGGGFMLDDHRCLRVLREYREGKRARPGVYEFLAGGAETRAEREAGWYPWWLADELKYRHMRPLAEWALYGEYRVFGHSALGYRLVSLGLYLWGVWLVYDLLRLFASNERLARWGGLLFAVASCHTIPVVFVSAQADLTALVLAAGGLVLSGRYIRDGGIGRLAGWVGCLAAGLLTKEAMLPVAVLPAVMWWSGTRARKEGEGVPAGDASNEDAGIDDQFALQAGRLCHNKQGQYPTVGGGKRSTRRRVMWATGGGLVVGLVWLAVYARGGYGSNTVVMLDPIGAPWDYLRALPWRALLLLSSWVIPVNPFLFEIHADYRWCQYLYAIVGPALLAIPIVIFWRLRGQELGVPAMALFALLFIPILVCTPADDRVMMLPSIGLAYLGAVWLAGGLGGGAVRLGALLVLVGWQVTSVAITTAVVRVKEGRAQRRAAMMVEALGRAPRAGDCLWMIDGGATFETLFMQDRVRGVGGAGGILAGALCDQDGAEVTRIDDRTLRLTATGRPLLDSFQGDMGAARGRPRRIGDAWKSGEVTGRIVEVDGSGVRAVELRFTRPIDDEGYRFFRRGENGAPELASFR